MYILEIMNISTTLHFVTNLLGTSWYVNSYKRLCQKMWDNLEIFLLLLSTLYHSSLTAVTTSEHTRHTELIIHPAQWYRGGEGGGECVRPLHRQKREQKRMTGWWGQGTWKRALFTNPHSLSILWSSHSFIYPSASISVCLSIHPSIQLSVHLSSHPSIHFPLFHRDKSIFPFVSHFAAFPLFIEQFLISQGNRRGQYLCKHVLFRVTRGGRETPLKKKKGRGARILIDKGEF